MHRRSGQVREAPAHPCERNREVWLVLGNMLSGSTLVSNLRSGDPAPETLQLNHLLQVTIASIGAAIAKVRTFCAP